MVARNDSALRPRKKAWHKRRKNHGKPRPAASLAEDALRRVIPDERLAITRIQLAWSRAVDVRLQQVAWPVALTRGEVVLLHVRDNQWLHELSYLRADLLRRLAAACKAVGTPIADLRFRVGEIEVLPPPERPPPPPGAMLSPEPARSTIAAMESVSDATLRQAIANARLALGTD